MRKLVSLLLVALFLFCSAASAENLDLSAMSEEELYQLIDAARLELTKYNPVASEGFVLYEDESIRITYRGEIVVDEYDNLLLSVIAENLTEHNIGIYLENVSCNGWEISEAMMDIPAGKKTKDEFDFYNGKIDAELETAADVQEIECTIRVFDTGSYDTLYTTDSVVWNFGQ